MLAQRYAHPRDSKISFQEEGHLYTIEGMEEHPTSVNGILHQYFPKFDADKIISKMMKGRNWRNSEYFGMTPEQIKAQWEKNGQESRDLGEIMHQQIEDYLNGVLEETPDTPEFQQFLQFWSDLKAKYPDVVPHRTEWRIYDEVKKVAGSVDCTVINEKGEIIILDWKRSKEIKKENEYEKGSGPFAHLDNCNFNHYSLQLGAYRHILETYYGVPVIGMFLVVCHPNQETYQFIRVPDRKPEILELWKLL